MKDELYINGQEIELDQSEAVGFTYQVYSIAQMTPQAAYSNQFVIPLTTKNTVALNFSDRIATNSLAPYRQLPCTFIRGGVSIISNGVAIIEGAQGNYQVTIYSYVFDLFTQIGDLSLKNIDWSYLNHQYDLNTIKTINENFLLGNSDICWPLIQWGGISEDGEIDIKYQLPCLSYPVIIKKIFEKTNYSYSGKIFSDQLFENITMTLSPDVYSVDDATLVLRSFKSSLNVDSYDSGTLSLITLNLINILAFFNITNEYDDYDSEYFYRDNINPTKVSVRMVTGARSVYEQALGYPSVPDGRGGMTPGAPPLNQTSYRSSWFETISINAHFWYFCQSEDNSGNDADIAEFKEPQYVILKNDQIVIKIQLDTDAQLLFDNQFIMDVIPGDVIKVYIEFQELKVWKIVLDEHSYMSIVATNSLLINSELNYNALIPDIKLKDILLNLCQKFALIITPDKSLNKVSFTGFAEIKADIANAEDWSDKIDLSQPPLLTYRIGDYGSVNNLKWKSDTTTNGFGDSSFSIDDNTITSIYNFIELIYPSALAYNNIVTTSDSPPGGNTSVQIPRYTLVASDEWQAYIQYSKGDKATRNNIIYIALYDNQNIIPGDDSPAVWEKIPLQYEQSLTSDARLVIVRQLSGDNGSPSDSIIFTDGENEINILSKNIPLAYFADPTQYFQLTYDFLISIYWKEFVAMLNKLKVLNILIRINDVDISKLDFLTLKYISHFGNHFYLTVVNEYLSGQSTQCELIRM